MSSGLKCNVSVKNDVVDIDIKGTLKPGVGGYLLWSDEGDVIGHIIADCANSGDVLYDDGTIEVVVDG